MSVSSLSSITRLSASLASTGRSLLTEVLELAELTVDLLLHVQRLLALPLAPLVAGDHQLADLVPELAVGAEAGAGGLGREQLLDLGVHVEGPAPLCHAPIGARLDHLAALLFSHLRGDGADRAP